MPLEIRELIIKASVGDEKSSPSTSNSSGSISDESTTEAPVLSLEIENVLSVESHKNFRIGLYPNPLRDGQLTISLKGFEPKNAKLDIYALTGALVYSKNLERNSNLNFQTHLDLNPGLYIIRVEDGLISKTQKLIVQ